MPRIRRGTLEGILYAAAQNEWCHYWRYADQLRIIRDAERVVVVFDPRGGIIAVADTALDGTETKLDNHDSHKRDYIVNRLKQRRS